MSNSLFLSMSLPEITSDADRLAALDSYGILNTPPEEGFDDIVQLATLTCNVPVALVSLVAGNRQWFKARIGFEPCETDLDSSVCAYALVEPDMLVIPDLTTDPRTRNNPLVIASPHLRFYGGIALRNEQGHALGSLCVMDTTPRPEGLTDAQATALRTLARQVMALMALRRSVIGRNNVITRRRAIEAHLGETAARLRLSEAHWRGLFERLREGFVIAEVVRTEVVGAEGVGSEGVGDEKGAATDWRYLDANAAWGELVGIDPRAAIGRTVREVFPGIEDEWVQAFAQVVETREPAVFTQQVDLKQRWYEGRAFPLDGDQFAILFVETTDRVLAEMRRNALLEIGDQLRDLTSVAELTARASSIVGQALGASRVGFGQLDPAGEHVVVEPDWTAPGTATITGQHRFQDYGNIRSELLLGEPLVIGDVLTDPRTAADPAPMIDAGIRSLVNIPIQEHGRTVALFLVHDIEPREWAPEIVAFLRNVADRLTSAVARLKAEEKQRLLNEELSHRMKNMLAMVQAIASQTLKGVTEREAVAGFRDRIQALSSAHDVLLQTSWEAAPLHDVVETVLRRSSQIERLLIEGPAIDLGSRATLSISLLLHELATNAVKYGALSVETGRIAVTWSVEASTAELVFRWRETGGPTAVEPTRLGFGSRLLRSGLIGTGGVRLRYLPTGLDAEMRACLEQVQAS